MDLFLVTSYNFPNKNLPIKPNYLFLKFFSKNYDCVLIRKVFL
jgi:hypothetical protein